MPDKSFQSARVSLREAASTFGLFLLLALALLVVGYWVLDPAPPHRVVLATGTDDGAYAAFGRRYAALLERHRVSVELRPTQGAAHNLALLRDPASDVDIAFVQGGADGDTRPVDLAERNAGLVSLGSVFFEPVWLFYREDAARRLLGAPALASLTQLAGWRLDIGAPGSGVPALVRLLLEANRIDPGTIAFTHRTQTPAVMALLDGSVDALVLVTAPEAPMVQMLLQTPGIRLFDFAQAEAYSRRFTFMSPVVLPRGVVDLARDVPPADVRLVAPTAALVARAGTHPALVQLFVQAAAEVHSQAGWFQRRGDFPNTRDTERPLADEAARYYAEGVPFLQRYLPFWLANLIERMWPVLVTLVAILIPLSRALPPLYAFRIRSRIFRWYAQLRDIEAAQGRRPPQTLEDELEALDARVVRIAVPLSYADELYALRTHISLVRRRLRGAAETADAAGAGEEAAMAAPGSPRTGATPGPAAASGGTVAIGRADFPRRFRRARRCCRARDLRRTRRAGLRRRREARRRDAGNAPCPHAFPSRRRLSTACRRSTRRGACAPSSRPAAARAPSTSTPPRSAPSSCTTCCRPTPAIRTTSASCRRPAARTAIRSACWCSATSRCRSAASCRAVFSA